MDKKDLKDIGELFDKSFKKNFEPAFGKAFTNVWENNLQPAFDQINEDLTIIKTNLNKVLYR